MNHLVIQDEIRNEIEALLATAAPLESGCFCLVREAETANGRRLLVGEVLAPPDTGAWDSQHTDQLVPSAEWMSFCVGAANQNDCGLLWVHSHPNPAFPAEFSQADRRTLDRWANYFPRAIDGAFAAAVVSPHGWFAEVAVAGKMISIPRISGVGRTLSNLAPAIRISALDDALDARQRDALGVAHDRLRELSVGLVGCGGLGSPIAEQLTRMGVKELVLLEHDVLDTPSNVRRVFGSRMEHLSQEPSPPKVDIVGDHLDVLGLSTQVRRVDGDVRVEANFRKLLDCDVVLCATDTHGSRSVVNDLASAFLLPVIDVGVRASSRAGELAGLVAEVRVLTPTTPCLWCRGTINPMTIRAENMPAEQRDELVAEGYLPNSTNSPEPSVVALTVLGGALATCALLSLLSAEGEVAPSAYWIDGFMGDSYENELAVPRPDCKCRQQVAMGDKCSPRFVPAGVLARSA